jgi:hypothetical protein
MMKPLLVLSLLLAIPAAPEKVKAPNAAELIELRNTVKELREQVAEHQERLAIHKSEINALRNRVETLQARETANQRPSR